MVLALTVPMRQFFAQRERLAVAQDRHAEQAARVAALEAQKARLADPAYVERLARERLRYVRPGEVPFIVLTPSASSRPGGRNQAGSLEPPAPGRAWYAQLWSSVEAAGARPSPSPTVTPTR